MELKWVFNCFCIRSGGGKLLTDTYELEKLDHLHRYQPNLEFYEAVWRLSRTNDRFFTWLNDGNGKDLDLEVCPRARLERERVRYLTLSEREHFEVVIVEGKLFYKRNGEAVNTKGNLDYIYVLSPNKKLYVAAKVKGEFHHSSFLDGGDVLSAGHLHVRGGELMALSASSGHYKPGEANFERFKRFLRGKGVDLKDVQIIRPRW